MGQKNLELLRKTIHHSPQTEQMLQVSPKINSKDSSVVSIYGLIVAQFS